MMIEMVLSGDQALAYGAWHSGLSLVTSYPGSPSSGTVKELVKLSSPEELTIEWSANEKVALEKAIGAAIAGRRTMVCVKSVGMNVALDPIMVSNLIGTHAGMVWLIGDDPGAWGSQNEQDSRFLAAFAELPLLEPSSPQEGYDMMRYAFQLSERFHLPVIIREIYSYSQGKGPCRIAEEPWRPVTLPSAAAERWISYPLNVLENHARLHQRNREIAQEFDASPFNRVDRKGGKGVLAAGSAWQKLESAGLASRYPLSLYKLGTVHPLPQTSLLGFLSLLEEVLVLEENEPFLERELRVLLHDQGLRVRVRGRLSGEVRREGELLPSDLEEALGRLVGKGIAKAGEGSGGETKTRALEKGFCEGCPYIPLFQAMREICRETGIADPIITADPGCAVRLNLPPFQMLNLKFCMGASIGLAAGVSRAGVKERVVAACGDSSFFHTGINALADAAHHQADILVLILDNGGAALTGLQPHPGNPRNARGERTPAVEIERIVRAMPIDFVQVIDMFDSKASKPILKEALTRRGLAVIIAKGECPLLAPLERGPQRKEVRGEGRKG